MEIHRPRPGTRTCQGKKIDILQAREHGNRNAAVHAEEILTGSLVNARAVADYISRRQPETVSLVAMGNGGERDCKGGCDLRPVYQMSSGGQTLPYRRGNTVPEDSRLRTFL